MSQSPAGSAAASPSHAPSRAFSVTAPVYTAVGWMLGAMASFAALDTLTKVMGAMAPVFLVLWFRCLFQATLSSALQWPRRRRLAEWRTQHLGLQWLRALSQLGCAFFAFTSLKYLPLAEFTAIVMLSPLTVTMMAARRTGERVGPLRWALLCGGLVGALIILRPGGSVFGWAAVLPLCLVACNTAYQLTTARLAAVEDSGLTQCYTGWIGALVTSLALPWSWQMVSGQAWMLMVILGLIGTAGHLMMLQSYRRAAPSRLAPFLYTQLGFATLGSWWVFEHTPDAATWVGILTIAACGAASAAVPVATPSR